MAVIVRDFCGCRVTSWHRHEVSRICRLHCRWNFSQDGRRSSPSPHTEDAQSAPLTIQQFKLFFHANSVHLALQHHVVKAWPGGRHQIRGWLHSINGHLARRTEVEIVVSLAQYSHVRLATEVWCMDASQTKDKQSVMKDKNCKAHMRTCRVRMPAKAGLGPEPISSTEQEKVTIWSRPQKNQRSCRSDPSQNDVFAPVPGNCSAPSSPGAWPLRVDGVSFFLHQMLWTHVRLPSVLKHLISVQTRPEIGFSPAWWTQSSPLYWRSPTRKTSHWRAPDAQKQSPVSSLRQCSWIWGFGTAGKRRRCTSTGRCWSRVFGHKSRRCMGIGNIGRSVAGRRGARVLGRLFGNDPF